MAGITKISKAQKNTIIDRRKAGDSCKQIADDIGVSKQRVSQLSRHVMTPRKIAQAEATQILRGGAISVANPAPGITAIAKQAEQPKVDNFASIGNTGLERTGGYIVEEFLPELSGQRASQMYKEMLYNDAIVSAAIRVIEMMARQVKWITVPGEPTDEAAGIAEFVDSVFNDMDVTWTDTIAEILSLVPFGFSLHEKIFKLRLGDNKDPSKRSTFNDGKVGLRGLPIRAQDTVTEWKFNDDTGEIDGAWQSALPNLNRVFIPSSKSLLFRSTTHKNNPEGFALLRNAYTSYYFRKQLSNLQAIGLERNATGMPIIRIPSKDMVSGNAFYVAMQAAVRQIRVNDQMGLILQSDRDDKGNFKVTFEFASVTGTMPDFETPIKRYSMEIALTLMADFLMLGHEKVGSFALADSKTHTFALSLGAWLDSIAAIINKDLIPQLLRLNGLPTENPPLLTHSDIETPDIAVIGTYLQALAGSGMALFPNEQLETWLIRAMGAPESVVDDMKQFFDRDMSRQMAEAEAKETATAAEVAEAQREDGAQDESE